MLTFKIKTRTQIDKAHVSGWTEQTYTVESISKHTWHNMVKKSDGKN